MANLRGEESFAGLCRHEADLPEHRALSFEGKPWWHEWQLLPTRTGVGLSLRTVKTRTHKLTVDLISGAGELKDLENDPNELVIIFEDPTVGGIRKMLEGFLAQ